MENAFFVSPQLHERSVTLADGSTHRLHFRELSIAQLRAYQLAERSDDEATQASSVCKLIAASVCEPDGQPALTEDHAARLKPQAANALLREIMSINGAATDQAKKP